MDYKKVILSCVALSVAFTGCGKKEEPKEIVTARISLTKDNVMTNEEYQFDMRCYQDLKGYFWEPTTWMQPAEKRQETVDLFNRAAQMGVLDEPQANPVEMGRVKAASTVSVDINQPIELIDAYRVRVRYSLPGSDEKPLLVSHVLLWDSDGDKNTVECVGALMATSRQEQWQINDGLRILRHRQTPIYLSEMASGLSYFRVLDNAVRIRD